MYALQWFLTMLDEVAHILDKHRDLAAKGVPQSDAAILCAERALGVKFPCDFFEYLMAWGWLSFGPNEYYGLGVTVNDIVNRTLDARIRLNLPTALVLICNHDGDEFVCIDTRINNQNSDFGVVIWDIPTRSISRTRALNFAQFLASDLRAIVD